MDMRWIGIAMMGGFTLLWASFAVAAGGAWMVPGLAEIVWAVVLLASLVPLFGRMRAGRGVGGGPAEYGDRNRRAGRTMIIAIVAEFVVIFLAVRLAALADPDLVMPVIALVVGAHFLFFWFSRATRSRLHLWMTALGVAIGAAGIAAILSDADPRVVRACVGLGMGGITIAYGTLFALRLARGDRDRHA